MEGPDRAWFGRMEQKMDMLLADSHDHEKRIRGLEKFRNWVTGLAAAGTSAGAALGSFFKFTGKG